MTEGERTDSFSLVDGGPTQALFRRIRLVRNTDLDVLRISSALIVITWLPPVLITIIEALRGRAEFSVLLDFPVHVRFWVSLPLLFFAERVLHYRTRSVSARLLNTGVVEPQSLPQLSRILKIVGSFRDAFLAEFVIGLVVVVNALLFTKVDDFQLLARSWYQVVSLPIFQFFLLRSIYRWLLWSVLLACVARLSLCLVPMHPDRAAGLSFIAEPVFGFALVAAAASSSLNATWASRLSGDRVALDVLAIPIVSFLCVVFVFILGPLLVFSMHLHRERLMGLRRYGFLARKTGRSFHERWIKKDSGCLLDANDPSALTDYISAFSTIDRMRFVLFSRREVLEITVATIFPSLWLVFTQVPPAQLAVKLIEGILK